LVLWATAPYLPLLVKTSKPQPVPAGNLVIPVGYAIIGVAGLGLYLDAVWRHPAPLSTLVFLVVPLYQWAAVFLLLLINYLWAHRVKSLRSSRLDITTDHKINDKKIS
jgi:hypothetical protein